MSDKARILAFGGSLRKDSFNHRAAAIAAEGAREAGAEVTLIQLRDFPLPVFDQDLEAEQGLHPNGRKLKDLFNSHDALLISSPEYNSSVTAALKNAIDWVSRPEKGRPPLEGFTGKVAALVSASPGGLGGIRGLVHLKAILGNIGVIVLPDQLCIVKAHEAFGADGKLNDAKLEAGLQKIGAGLAKAAGKIKG